MPRNMSFMLTTDQIRNRTKTVTRRLGWQNLKPGEVLNACVKCMGLKRGEKIEKIATIRVVHVQRERLGKMTWNKLYGCTEARLEGFPQLNGDQFVALFRRHTKALLTDDVTRIEFEYVDDTLLNDHQLDAAAAKLGAIRLISPGVARAIVRDLMRQYPHTVAAIIHAVTHTQRIDEPTKCTKCCGEGWLWWYERDDRAGHDSSEWITDDTKYPCDVCQKDDVSE